MDKKSLNITAMLEGLYEILKSNGRDQGTEVDKSADKKEVRDFTATKHKGMPSKVANEDCDVKTDEDLEMFSRKPGTRRALNNPWNNLKKSGRHFKTRTRTRGETVANEECAGVGIITKQNSTVDVTRKTPQKNLDAFNLEEAMQDMYNTYLKESGVKKISKTAASSIKGAVTSPSAGGSMYKAYRFGLALAGAPEYPTKATNEIGGDPLLTTYTDEEWDMVKYASKQSDNGTPKRLSSNRSVELPDTNTTSIVANIKKNKYGV